jgi:hypothetical protein
MSPCESASLNVGSTDAPGTMRSSPQGLYSSSFPGFLVTGYFVQTWEANSSSRCDSKFRIISSNELPEGAPEGLKTQVQAEQPKPRKFFFSIHISLRLAAITGARQNCGYVCFEPFFTLISFKRAASFNARERPSA